VAKPGTFVFDSRPDSVPNIHVDSCAKLNSLTPSLDLSMAQATLAHTLLAWLSASKSLSQRKQSLKQTRRLVRRSRRKLRNQKSRRQTHHEQRDGLQFMKSARHLEIEESKHDSISMHSLHSKRHEKCYIYHQGFTGRHMQASYCTATPAVRSEAAGDTAC
jgi:hypothetical protein